MNDITLELYPRESNARTPRPRVATTQPIEWLGAALTHRGKRRQNNEDAVLDRAPAGLWAVADGMGGHEHGELASQSICKTLAAASLAGSLADRVDEVENRILEVNDNLRAYARVHCEGATIGSTVVALLAHNRVGVALWAGDSRLYRYRLGRLEQITRDHSPAYDLFEAGALTEAELQARDSNVITRAVGSQQDLHLDLALFDIEPLDTFLLCSDGLYREVLEDELRGALNGDQVEHMSQQLLAQTLRTPARDNVSIVVAHAGLSSRSVDLG